MKPELQRRVQRYGWDYSSPHYENGWQSQLWPAQERLIGTAGLKPGEKVLDISCGTGLVSFPVAEAVGSEGEVVGIDLSEGMIQEAGLIAEAEGLQQVSFLHMDAEELDLPDNAFDIAINSLGLMYYPEPDRAACEMHRVLKPGGRAAVLVWGRRSKCGWAEIFPIMDWRVQSDVCPLFFQLGTGENLSHLLHETGLDDIRSERFEIDLHYDSEEEAIVGAFLGGAVAMAYRKFDDRTKQEAHAEYLESIAPYRSGGGYDIPGEFVICTGRKA